MALSTLENLFTYHAPNADSIPKFEKIRAAGLEMAAVIEAQAPNCADRSCALRCIREAVLWANAAVALDGQV